MDTQPSPAPNPAPEAEIHLNTYLAIQTKANEHASEIAKAFCIAGKSVGHLFRRVETLDVIQIGMKPFRRVRTDLPAEKAHAVLAALHKATGQAIVYPTADGTYEVQFPPNVLGGRISPIPSGTLYLMPRGTAMMFRGPKIKNWERQFPGLV